MPQAPRILLIGDDADALDRLHHLLDRSPRSTARCSVAQAPRQLRQQRYDILLLLCDAQAQRALALEPWLCELPLGGPQPLLILTSGKSGTTLPTLALTKLTPRTLKAAIVEALRQRQQLRDQLRGEMAHALIRGEMELRYQPVFDLQRRALDHVEVLMRWRHPIYGLIGPENFLDVAETSGAIHPLGIWALRRACEQQRQWCAQGLPLIPLSINVADCQLDKPAFAAAVDDCLPAPRQPRALGLEISASALGRCSAANRRLLTQWHGRGMTLTADHLRADQRAAPLQGLPLDALKVDRTLIADCEQPAQAAALKSLLELGQSLGCDMIAGGVERRETARFLHRQHCDRLQGFCVARPLAGAEMAAWWRQLPAY